MSKLILNTEVEAILDKLDVIDFHIENHYDAYLDLQKQVDELRKMVKELY